MACSSCTLYSGGTSAALYYGTFQDGPSCVTTTKGLKLPNHFYHDIAILAIQKQEKDVIYTLHSKLPKLLHTPASVSVLKSTLQLVDAQITNLAPYFMKCTYPVRQCTPDIFRITYKYIGIQCTNIHANASLHYIPHDRTPRQHTQTVYT